MPPAAGSCQARHAPRRMCPATPHMGCRRRWVHRRVARGQVPMHSMRETHDGCMDMCIFFGAPGTERTSHSAALQAPLHFTMLRPSQTACKLAWQVRTKQQARLAWLHSASSVCQNTQSVLDKPHTAYQDILENSSRVPLAPPPTTPPGPAAATDLTAARCQARRALLTPPPRPARSPLTPACIQS